jgi:hypothetical protein
MPSHKQHNCLCLMKIIATFGFTLITCDHCSAVLSFCIIMTGHAKCSECTCHGCSCVLVSLDSLNHAHLQLKSELKVTMNECVNRLSAFSSWMWRFFAFSRLWNRMSLVQSSKFAVLLSNWAMITMELRMRKTPLILLILIFTEVNEF